MTLHTHFLVRDDAQQLYGFATRMERDLFRALMRIPSVGPKLAMAVISTFDLDELAGAAAQGDAAYLTRVPGIGRKTAERMLIDLQDRLSEFDLQPGRAGRRVGAAAGEAERALVALGYRAGEGGAGWSRRPGAKLAPLRRLSVRPCAAPERDHEHRT